MASISIMNGADIISVSRKLGHLSVAITLNVYSHSSTAALLRANELLADTIYKDKMEGNGINPPE